MAFMGVLLGLFARVAADQGMFAELGYLDPSNMDAEIGLPLLLRSILPVGLMGLMMSAYFSAIMSTADSCLMAASGNLQTDVLGRWLHSGKEEKSILRNSQVLTLVVGIIALVLAAFMQNVLTLMLYSYAFMVSGLFVPVLGALFMDKPSSLAAFLAMLLGGGVTLTLILTGFALPFELDANIFGITTALATFIIVNYIKGRIAIKTAVS
jgi:SSS family solute:Na+ symporter